MNYSTEICRVAAGANSRTQAVVGSTQPPFDCPRRWQGGAGDLLNLSPGYEHRQAPALVLRQPSHKFWKCRRFAGSPVRKKPEDTDSAGRHPSQRRPDDLSPAPADDRIQPREHGLGPACVAERGECATGQHPEFLQRRRCIGQAGKGGGPSGVRHSTRRSPRSVSPKG